MRFFTIISLILCLSFSLCGCQNEVKKVHAICAELEDVATMTSDCDKMADQLKPVLKRLAAWLKTENSSLSAQEEREVVLEIGICMSALFRIRSEACKNHEGVVSALEVLDNQNQ